MLSLGEVEGVARLCIILRKPVIIVDRGIKRDLLLHKARGGRSVARRDIGCSTPISLPLETRALQDLSMSYRDWYSCHVTMLPTRFVHVLVFVYVKVCVSSKVLSWNSALWFKNDMWWPRQGF
jgi:hypothetical protein